MRRNPLLYSNPSEIEQIPAPASPPQKEAAGKSSFFFYFIILANSLLVLFVLGFIWFLFLKSPDLQIKEISDRWLGTGEPTKQAPQTIVAPEIQTEMIISPTQQEKDETQQAKLKQMREREELAAERVRLEAIKAEIEQEKTRANEARRAIESLKNQKSTVSDTTSAATSPATEDNNADNVAEEQAVEIEQTRIEDLTTQPSEAPKIAEAVTEEKAVIPNAANEPAANSTSSQVDLIMEALKNQQTQTD